MSEYTCGSCEGCNSCDSSCQDPCYTCNACIACENCDNCNSDCNNCNEDCNSAQVICSYHNTLSGYLGYNFAWTECIEAGQVIGLGKFDRIEFNKIYTYLSKRSQIGSPSWATGGSVITNNETKKSLTASEFNKIANALSVDTRESGELIKGSYFRDLAEAVNIYEYNKSACWQCNTSCNANCDECLADCDTCLNCDTDNSDACGDAEICVESCKNGCYDHCCHTEPESSG